MKKKIFIITGEVSGDILAEKIIYNLLKHNIEIQGIVGNKLRSKVVSGPFDNNEITFFGIVDVLKNIFFIKKKINQAVDYIEKFKPDLVFSIDSPDFVFQVIKKIKSNKKINTKFYHYVAPTIWAWREQRAFKIKRMLNKIYLLFHFEKKYFDKYQIDNEFVGHPFFENFNENLSEYNPESKIISFCPGSRISEINILFPIFLKIMVILGKSFTYHYAVTKNTENIIKEKLNYYREYNLIINSNDNDKDYHFKKSIIAVAKSGTISLNICKCQIPFLTIYKFSWLNYLLIKPFVKVKFVNIVNIIANKMIIPEFVQNNCDANKISSHLKDLITNKDKLVKMIKDYNLVIKKFSNKDTNKKIASDILVNL